MPGENTSSDTGASGSASTPSGETWRLSISKPLTSKRHRAFDREVHDGERTVGEAPRGGDAHPAVALHFERRGPGEGAGRVAGGDEHVAVLGLLFGDHLDVGQRGERVASQQRVGGCRRQARRFELGGVDRDAGDRERVGGATLREQAEVALDERGRAVELAVERRRLRRRRRPRAARRRSRAGSGRVRAAAAGGCRGCGRSGDRSCRAARPRSGATAAPGATVCAAVSMTAASPSRDSTSTV